MVMFITQAVSEHRQAITLAKKQGHSKLAMSLLLAVN
jgi:hypothetical protein